MCMHVPELSGDVPHGHGEHLCVLFAEGRQVTMATSLTCGIVNKVPLQVRRVYRGGEGLTQGGGAGGGTGYSRGEGLATAGEGAAY